MILIYMIKPLTNGDVMRYTGCKFILYEHMKDIKSIDELLPMTLILYQLNPDVGHFCCILENSHGIQFFDPIGMIFDQELKYCKQNKQMINHDFTYLAQLLANSNRNVDYNHYQYQTFGSMACGYWCIFRMLMKDLTNEQFHTLFKPLVKKDNKIVKLLNQI